MYFGHDVSPPPDSGPQATPINYTVLEPTANSGCPCLATLIGLRFEDEIDGLCLVARNGHILRLIAVRFMPRRDRELAGGQVRETEATVPAGNGVVGILEHREDPMHPRMDVALHRDELRLAEFFDKRRSSRGLRLIPFVIDFGQGMNVVRSRIVVHDFKFLVDDHRNAVRYILAALLVDRTRLCRRGIIRPPPPDLYNHVQHRVARAPHNRFLPNLLRTLLAAAPLLAQF